MAKFDFKKRLLWLRRPKHRVAKAFLNKYGCLSSFQGLKGIKCRQKEQTVYVTFHVLHAQFSISAVF